MSAYDKKLLLRLADSLDAKALVADAKAKDHRHAKELDDAEKEDARAELGRMYASACRYFHGRLASREKRGEFVPPTLAEVQVYASEECSDWPAEDIRQWHDHFETTGWRIKGGAPMVNWKAAARNGARYWRKAQTGASRRGGVAEIRTGATRQDHPRWRTFLREVGKEYVEEWRAQPYLKTDFQKWLKK